ncbi:MAG: hypothetical protein EOO50_00925 [Flavobacterium sp.]|uniref:hypothetical protein n=1 Tax=Flavobacterium sp. TaxID=239 RepID=UPI0011F843CD|nr:hypothetical protein [Flavobacterium sp.]RZJ68774.1 MAG: hypothetical protein EOO50_00925 [Flavobacterium sp.]
MIDAIEISILIIFAITVFSAVSFSIIAVSSMKRGSLIGGLKRSKLGFPSLIATIFGVLVTFLLHSYENQLIRDEIKIFSSKPGFEIIADGKVDPFLIYPFKGIRKPRSIGHTFDDKVKIVLKAGNDSMDLRIERKKNSSVGFWVYSEEHFLASAICVGEISLHY